MVRLALFRLYYDGARRWEDLDCPVPKAISNTTTRPHVHGDARRVSTCFDRLLARGAAAYDLHQVPAARAEENQHVRRC